jgi:hypothetical protein
MNLRFIKKAYLHPWRFDRLGSGCKVSFGKRHGVLGYAHRVSFKSLPMAHRNVCVSIPVGTGKGVECTIPTDMINSCNNNPMNTNIYTPNNTNVTEKMFFFSVNQSFNSNLYSPPNQKVHDLAIIVWSSIH